MEERSAFDEHWDRFNDYLGRNHNPFKVAYILIVCAIPYLVLLYRILLSVDDFWDILTLGMVALGFFFAWALAVLVSFYLDFLANENLLLFLFNPLLSISFSWIVLIIAVNIMSIFGSGSYLGWIDPRFL